ncbi:MAG: YqaA family protein [Bdellovibrionota bacterium]
MKMKQRMQKLLHHLQLHAGAWWYPPVIGLLALADLFILIVPTDAILVSAVMLNPRRWIYTALMVALGSSIGAVMLALVLRYHGLPFLLHIYPGIDHSAAWKSAIHLVEQWGAWGLFGIAISPLPQHAAIAVAALTGMNGLVIFGSVMAGRAVKYLFLAWLASHAPKLLGKVWGMQYEIKAIGGLEDKK